VENRRRERIRARFGKRAADAGRGQRYPGADRIGAADLPPAWQPSLDHHRLPAAAGSVAVDITGDGGRKPNLPVTIGRIETR
jgi:hypothetical protein